MNLQNWLSSLRRKPKAEAIAEIQERGKLGRRGFLGLLAGSAALAVADPEALLWTPGEKTIIVPSAKLLADIDVNALIAAMVDRGPWMFYNTVKIPPDAIIVSSLSSGVPLHPVAPSVSCP